MLRRARFLSVRPRALTISARTRALLPCRGSPLSGPHDDRSLPSVGDRRHPAATWRPRPCRPRKQPTPRPAAIFIPTLDRDRCRGTPRHCGAGELCAGPVALFGDERSRRVTLMGGGGTGDRRRASISSPSRSERGTASSPAARSGWAMPSRPTYLAHMKADETLGAVKASSSAPSQITSASARTRKKPPLSKSTKSGPTRGSMAMLPSVLKMKFPDKIRRGQSLGVVCGQSRGARRGDTSGPPCWRSVADGLLLAMKGLSARRISAAASASTASLWTRVGDDVGGVATKIVSRRLGYYFWQMPVVSAAPPGEPDSRTEASTTPIARLRRRVGSSMPSSAGAVPTWQVRLEQISREGRGH